METLPLSEVKAKLSEIAERVEREHEHVTVTRNGRRSAVLVSADEWDWMHETLYWLAKPGIAQIIATTETELARQATVTVPQARAILGRGPGRR